MRTKLEIVTASGLVVLADAGLALAPSGAPSRPLKRYFLELADQGKLFLLDGEERSLFRLLVCVDDEPSDLPRHRFKRLSGSFVLPVPSGRLSVSDHTQRESARELPVAPGDYSVSVLGVGQGEHDSAAFRAERVNLLGEKDWRFRRWVDWFGVVGVVPFVAALVVILVYKLSLVSLVAAAVGIVSLLPRWLISRSRRYRETERRLHEHEASFPHFVLDLRRVDSAAGLVGGHFVV